jgi:5S rRNA maturation endonuclease (ribonuclease M5)
MKIEHIEKLLNMLGCDKVRLAGPKIRSTCPLAPWKHGGGVDKNPSLAVYVSDDDTGGVNCMSGGCNFKGSLTELIYKLQYLSKRDLSAHLAFVSERSVVNLDKRMSRIDAKAGHYAMPSETREPAVVLGGKDYSDPLIRASMSAALPESAVEMMEKMRSWIDQEAAAYLHGPDRRLTDETINKWKIGWHPQARRVSLPQFDRLGRLVNLSGRHVPYWPKCLPPSDREAKAPKWMHSNGFDREMFLFGEDWFEVSDSGRGTVFLVEGGFDVVYLDQCGLKNVAGINGSHINKTQVDKILKWFDSVVILMDGDQAGIEAAHRIESMLSRRIHTITHMIPDGRDPNQMEVEEVEDLKTRFR